MDGVGLLPNERWLEDRLGTHGELGANNAFCYHSATHTILLYPGSPKLPPFRHRNQVRSNKALYSTPRAIFRSEVAVEE